MANKLPILPLRDAVLIPHTQQPVQIGRQKSINALEASLNSDQHLLLVTQKDNSVTDPTEKDLHEVGTLCKLIQTIKNQDGTARALIEGVRRVKITKFSKNANMLYGHYDVISDEHADSNEARELLKEIKKEFDKYCRLGGKADSGTMMSISVSSNLVEVVDFILVDINMKVEDKVALLAQSDVRSRASKILEALKGENAGLEAQRRVQQNVKASNEEQMRRYFLEEQKRAIEKELGEGEDGVDDIKELSRKVKDTNFPEEARKRAEKEIKRLKSLQPMSAEAAVIRNYVDQMVSLPWGKVTQDNYDIENARKVLDADHYGMDKVKERILEQISVFAATKGQKGGVICLAGPAGTGKSTIAKSIAKALGRDYIKISLGGVSDEGEIRGHRKTYVGSMPGKIISAFKKSGSMNPVVLLDEVDKLSRDHKGDPAAALLEVLDPAQNNQFNDHFLEVDFDLSKCLFVATANYLENMSYPLKDRMEIIEISGYTEEEKLAIAKKHLVPKLIKDIGLENANVTFKDEALLKIIKEYVHEAGVRKLEKRIAKVLRKISLLNATKPKTSYTVTAKDVEKMLGPDRVSFGKIESKPQVGLVNGMAYNAAGGDLLQVEAVITPGSEKLVVTGQLGEVMKESSAIAFTVVKSLLKKEQLKDKDVNVHFPDGATPKDGPSAGIALVTAIYSVLTNAPVKNIVSMTGEVSLRGKVLPIGGVKEKVISAYRGGVREVILPEENRKNLTDIPEKIKNDIKIHFVTEVSEVLKLALESKKEKK